MKFLLPIFLISIISLSGCKTYSRFAKEPDITPEEQSVQSPRMTTDEYLRLAEILQKHLGRPYKGNSKYRPGVDCSRFTYEVFRDFNNTMLPLTAAEQFKQGQVIPYDRLSFGDLVFFRTVRREISHVGIWVGDGKFIHASTSNGVIISALAEKYWAERFAGARRIIQ